MAEYTLVEYIYVTAKTIKHRALMLIDKLMPHIFIRKSLFEYRPREVKPMLVEDVIHALGGTGNVRVVFEEYRQ